MAGWLMKGAGLAMFVAAFLPQFVFSADKGAHAVPQTRSGQVITDFGVSDIEVRSVQTLDVGNLNAKVREAAGKGESWIHEPVAVALQFVGAGLKGHTRVIEVRTPPEQRDYATITVTETGYLDDAVSGERWRLWLVKGSNGVWTLQRALWARLCHRAGGRFYSAQPCP